MKDATFYFDNPNIAQEIKMRSTFQYRYDSLFDGVMRPPMQSRKDLVNWTCQLQNNWMTEKGAPEELKMDCTNYKGLLDIYGPDYTTVKKKLGYIKGLIPDDI